MNRENYQRFAEPTTLVTTSMDTYSFTLPPPSTGLYIAVQDIGSCLTLSRLRVYRNNCKSRKVGLVQYPSAPPPTQPANISTTCVANAYHVGSENVTCTSDGTWGPATPVCQCRPGYQEVESECIGTYTHLIVGGVNVTDFVSPQHAQLVSIDPGWTQVAGIVLLTQS